MNANNENLVAAPGFLRSALLALALLNVALPSINLIFPFTASGGDHNLWSILATVIAPVMAPILVVVILFDYIMSRVRAADADGRLRTHFTRMARIDLLVMVATLLFWIPYFVWIL